MSKSNGDDSKTQKLWGEYENTTEDVKYTPNVSKEYLDNLIEQAMQPDILSKLQADSTPDKIMLKIGNERVLNTIELQEYYSKICELELKFNNQSASSDVEPVPPEPKQPQPINERYKQNCLNFIPSSATDFMLGIGESPPDIDAKTCRAALRRSILLLLAQIGYTEITNNTLDTFIDAVDEYYKTMIQAIRTKMNFEAQNRHTQFSDIYEHVFHDLGLGSVVNLHEFYQHRVINYETYMYKKCIAARNKYMKLIETKRKVPEIKDEKDSIPVLHVPENQDLAGYQSLFNLFPGMEMMLDQDPSCLVNLDNPTERHQNSLTTEESTGNYFDVEELSNFCQS